MGSYIQAYFTDVIYRGQEWNATQIIEYLESGIHYAKKEPGGLRRFDIKLLEQLNRRKRILDIMETSIRQRRFKVWYQPVFNLKPTGFLPQKPSFVSGIMTVNPYRRRSSYRWLKKPAL